MRNLVSAIIVSALFPHVAATAASEPVMPKALTYKGQPVVEKCIADLFGLGDQLQNSVDLAACSGQALESGEDVMYKYLGKLREAEFLLVYYDTSGSGRFSELMGLKRKGDTLVVAERVSGGDRCHGSLESAIISDTKLIVTKRVTPRMVWDLTDEPKTAAYDALEDSATSCVGLAKYVNGKFVSLVPDGSDSEWGLEADEENCFQRQLRAQPPKIPANKLKDFIHNYSAACATKS